MNVRCQRRRAVAYSTVLTLAGAGSQACAYDLVPMWEARAANFRTGYALWPMFQDQPAASGTGIGSFSGFTVQWLDAFGNVLWSQ